MFALFALFALLIALFCIVCGICIFCMARHRSTDAILEDSSMYVCVVLPLLRIRCGNGLTNSQGPFHGGFPSGSHFSLFLSLPLSLLLFLRSPRFGCVTIVQSRLCRFSPPWFMLFAFQVEGSVYAHCRHGVNETRIWFRPEPRVRLASAASAGSRHWKMDAIKKPRAFNHA